MQFVTSLSAAVHRKCLSIFYRLSILTCNRKTDGIKVGRIYESFISLFIPLISSITLFSQNGFLQYRKWELTILMCTKRMNCLSKYEVHLSYLRFLLMLKIFLLCLMHLNNKVSSIWFDTPFLVKGTSNFQSVSIKTWELWQTANP